MLNSSLASDVNCPRDLIGNQRIPVASHMTVCEKSANMSKNKNSNLVNLKCATWNVCGLNAPGKLENVLNEIEHLKADVCGISEMH